MIETLLTQFVSAWHDTSWVEMLAAVLAVAYLLLAIRQRTACWYAAFVSSALYVGVFFQARLYMDGLLNGFYAIMAIYGFLQWRRRRAGKPLGVTHWSLSRHAGALAVILVLALANSYILKRFTPAASPFLDSLVTWSSVFTTYLVARKVYENWYWWLVIDTVSLGLYLSRGLYLTALLFLLYLALIVAGMREWRRTAPAAYAAA